MNKNTKVVCYTTNQEINLDKVVVLQKPDLSTEKALLQNTERSLKRKDENEYKPNKLCFLSLVYKNQPATNTRKCRQYKKGISFPTHKGHFHCRGYLLALATYKIIKQMGT